ncbi:MAG: hypothetical protein II089_08050 [Selenomonas sp.]|nr:hypothetical protein [Selenomonas sp.]MBQ4213467.1 hypothetical protein [Selenomonas sp.]
MRRLHVLKVFWLAVLMMVAAAGTAMAGSQDFNLVNGTGRAITQIYLSPSHSSDWIYQDELGPKDVLYPGQSLFLKFSPRDNVQYWDIKVIYEDSKEDYWYNLDLYRIFTITIRPGGTVSIEST